MIQEQFDSATVASISFGSTSSGSCRAPRLLAMSYTNWHDRGTVIRILSSRVPEGRFCKPLMTLRGIHAVKTHAGIDRQSLMMARRIAAKIDSNPRREGLAHA